MISTSAITPTPPARAAQPGARLPGRPVDAACPGGPDTGGAGGYTLGDFGKIFYAGGPEVHADGEIWAETLWDLTGRRSAPSVAEKLVTDGMRLSPPEPSMLDMRNAILAAEQANGGGLNDEVWEVFRVRGMGYYAAAADGSDTQPVEDFSAPLGTGRSQGHRHGRRDRLHHRPADRRRARQLRGCRDLRRRRPTSRGRYTIPNMPAASYPKLTPSRPAGYNPVVTRDVPITGMRRPRATSLWIETGRPWRGADVESVSDNTSARSAAVSRTPSTSRREPAWSRVEPGSLDPEQESDGDPTVTIDLPATVDVTGVPDRSHAECGDDDLGGTGEYRVETARDGGDVPDRRRRHGRQRLHAESISTSSTRRNPAAGSGADTDLVRITLLSPQGTAGTGADFIDLTEFEVLGAAPTRCRPARSPSAPRTRSPARPCASTPGRSPTATRRSPATTGTSTATGRSTGPPPHRRRRSRTAPPGRSSRRSRSRTSAAVPARAAPR